MPCWPKRGRPRWPARPMATELARAKINLTLHVTGQRPDGYHLLDSLVVFADVGDVVAADPAGPPGLRITGPFADGLEVGPDNLVLRAARLIGVEAALDLEKNLPVASGIGGGSADAAATLRLLARLTGRAVPGPEVAKQLGADVPVCLAGRATRMQGVGERLAPLPPLPPGWLVLVNPGQAVSTPAVFRALTHRDHPPMPERLPLPATLPELAAFLEGQRNDLEPAARRLVPAIGAVIEALAAQPGCLLARMSGSGATCFGMFAAEADARAAEAVVRRAQPDWWTAAAQMIS